MPVTSCATRGQVSALNPASFDTAYLTEEGREGSFVWRTGDHAARVAADPLQGIFIASTSVPPSAGAWVRVHRPGDVDVTWWGAVFDYQPGMASPNHVGPALQAAIDYVAEAVNAPLDYQYGGVVRLPKGFGYLDDTDATIFVRSGVWLEGVSAQASGFVWNGTSATYVVFRLGTTDGTAAFNCGFRRLQIKNLQEGVLTTPGEIMIYTNSAQQDNAGLDSVYFTKGARTWFLAEIGYGGAATIKLDNVEANGVGGYGLNPDNPLIVLDYPSATVVINNLMIQGQTDPDGTVKSGLLLKRGRYSLVGGHSEELRRPIILDQDASGSWYTAVTDFQGGAHADALITSLPTDNASVHIWIERCQPNATGSVVYEDQRPGGGTIVGNQFLGVAR